MYVTSQDRIPTERVAPTEIKEGDLIIEGSMLLRVVSEPQTMHLGLGLFDDFRVMIRADVQDLEDGRLSARRWELEEELIRCSRTEADDDGS
jgi:hypothetical protein